MTTKMLLRGALALAYLPAVCDALNNGLARLPVMGYNVRPAPLLLGPRKSAADDGSSPCLLWHAAGFCTRP